MPNAYGKALLTGYRMAGADFLATEIEGMFRNIVTDEDKALHNMTLQKVLAMLGPDPKLFFKELARKTTEIKRKSYARMVAETILETVSERMKW